ncbi:MAG: 3-deoxy-manno-octulosonate cytidylyltransferase [Muribaculaceae bacterium]
MDNKFIGIIPARYASTRFPGKPLARLGGKYMIERVWNQVSSVLDSVLVATDDSRIFDAVEAFGGKAVMTGSEHRSGTDRCFEAYEKAGNGEEVIINIQGDEPFIQPEQLQAIMQCFDDEATQIATLVRPFDPSQPFEQLQNPNTPKVVIDDNQFACLFSRSVIPFVRGAEPMTWPQKTQYYTHIGMYAYRAEVLKQITRLPQSSLEIAESLEQLRWLQNGYKIKVGYSQCQTIGIDTPDDLKRAEEWLAKNGENK